MFTMDRFYNKCIFIHKHTHTRTHAHKSQPLWITHKSNGMDGDFSEICLTSITVIITDWIYIYRQTINFFHGIKIYYRFSTIAFHYPLKFNSYKVMPNKIDMLYFYVITKHQDKSSFFLSYFEFGLLTLNNECLCLFTLSIIYITNAMNIVNVNAKTKQQTNANSK